ncbi:recombinase family protein [Burkholderia cenocepacia]|uniref:recombinase family protein n=1 Tax=Burkholderia cenocepacia TaxID=95486 RepID=UPI001B99DAF2|nr:recombinase family protein [Burkholderia cenocepacia]MBR8071308.1 recombinase family protein [Burkholderia cenocepacia]
MSKTFLYARVSTSDQSTANQIMLAEKAGYVVAPRHVYEETISGTVAAMERPMFTKLVGKLDEGDKLVVTKLDRLGRNARDIDATVGMLRDMKVAVIVLDLPVVEVTSPAGDLVMRMFAAFAQFERDQLVERTHAGLARAKAAGKISGRPSSLTAAQRAEIKAKLAAGATARGLAKEYGVSHPTIAKAAADAT